MRVLPESDAEGGNEDGMFLRHYALLGIYTSGSEVSGHPAAELGVSFPNTFDLVNYCGVWLGLTLWDQKLFYVCCSCGHIFE